MSRAAAPRLDEQVEHPSPDAAVVVRRSWLGQVGLQVLGRWGARLGLLWIGVLTFFAVFAPLVASSFPYLFYDGQELSSPLIEELGAVDVWLLLSAFAGGLLALAWRQPGAGRTALWLWATLVLIPLAGWAQAARGWGGFAEALSLPPALGGNGSGVTLGLLVVWIVVGLAAVVALAGWIVAVVVLPWRAKVARWLKIATAIGLVIAGIVLVLDPPSPSEAIVYSRYREALAANPDAWAVHAPLPYSPNDRFAEIPNNALKNPSWTHPLGTTDLGEDLATRMIHACRIALTIGLIATGIAVVIGIVVGGLMGYFAGWTDLLGMRFVEVFEAIPVIFLLIMIVAFYGRNLYLMMAILGLTGWVGYMHFIRAEFLKLRSADFVQAARAAGVPLTSILFRHILPNAVTPVLVLASFGIASAILTEAVLSFLGLGLVDEPSWGQMLNQARSVGGGFHWWLAIYPGGAIFLTVFAYNLVGEALRDAIDPHTNKAAAA